jgi:hypothetical protein
MEQLLERIKSIPEERLAREKIKSDLLGSKIPPNEQEEVFLKSQKEGIEEARLLLSHLSESFSIHKIIEEQNIDVSYRSLGKEESFTSIGYFETPNQIILNKDVFDTEISSGAIQMLNIDRSMLKELIIAHEYFHFIQESKQELFVNQYKIKLWGIGFLQKYSTVHVLSEVAAAYFVKELYGLEWNPLILDWILLYPHFPKQVEESVKEYR